MLLRQLVELLVTHHKRSKNGLMLLRRRERVTEICCDIAEDTHVHMQESGKKTNILTQQRQVKLRRRYAGVGYDTCTYSSTVHLHLVWGNPI